MTDYASCWAPKSFNEAAWQIDTGNSGDAFWEWGRVWADKVMSYALPYSSTVLDYGCGVGRVLRHIPARNRIGVDVSSEMLALAKQNAPGCSFIQGSGAAIPVDDRSVDLVYSLLVLQHMDVVDVQSVLCDIGRVLARSGRCVLQFSGFGIPWAPDATIQRGPAQWTGNRNGSSHPAHQAIAYTKTAIRGMTENAGLIEKRIIEDNHDHEHPYYILVADI